MSGAGRGTVNDDHCFCCGRDNPQGLKLSFDYPAAGRAETACTIPQHFTGWKEITHGGFLAMLLDETMAHACISSGQWAVTAELTVRYRTPVATGRTIRVEAAVTRSRARIVEAEGRITDPEGKVVAEAQARFLKSPGGGGKPPEIRR